MRSTIFTDIPMKTVFPSVQWPPILDLDSSRLLLMLDYVEHVSQWLAEDVLLQQQFAQLHVLYHYAKTHTKFYRALKSYPTDLPTVLELAKNWQSLPYITISELISHNQNFFSDPLPNAHGKNRAVTHCLGHELIPIQGLKNHAVDLMDNLLHVRNYVWNQVNIQYTAARLVAGAANAYTVLNTWGKPFSAWTQTGPLYLIEATHPKKQAELIQKSQAQYLMCPLAIWNNLLNYYQTHPPTHWSIQKIIIEDGWAPDAMHNQTKSSLQTPLLDHYSISPFSIVALRCPEFGKLHVQSECIFVEIVDERGNACPKGSPGNLAITALHNFSFPLVRYQTGARAMWGETCLCKRTLPVLIPL